MARRTTTLNMFRNARDAVTFAPGQVVFAEGEPGDSMYVVVEGEVDISIGTRLVRPLGPGGCGPRRARDPEVAGR